MVHLLISLGILSLLYTIFLGFATEKLFFQPAAQDGKLLRCVQPVACPRDLLQAAAVLLAKGLGHSRRLQLWRLNSASRISVIASGYRNIKTGTAYSMIVLKPKFANRKDTTLKMIAHTR